MLKNNCKEKLVGREQREPILEIQTDKGKGNSNMLLQGRVWAYRTSDVIQKY